MGGDGDFDADVLDPFHVCFFDGWSAESAVELGGVVEGVAGVEDWECFGVDHLACSEDRVVEELGSFVGWKPLAAAERALAE